MANVNKPIFETVQNFPSFEFSKFFDIYIWGLHYKTFLQSLFILLECLSVSVSDLYNSIIFAGKVGAYPTLRDSILR